PGLGSRGERAGTARASARSGLRSVRDRGSPRGGARHAVRVGGAPYALARAARSAALVRERPQRPRPAADERRPTRLPRRALSRAARGVRPLSHARSDARRRQSPPPEARSALPSQTPRPRLRLSRRRARALRPPPPPHPPR